MELDLELAKELSQRKWQSIVDNEGSNEGITRKIPELRNLYNECAMCELVGVIEEKRCEECLYTTICGRFFIQWQNNKTVENAQLILTAITEANSR